MKILYGTFASDCDWHPKNYCRGKCIVKLQSGSRHDEISDGTQGTIQIEYDAESVFQPHWMIPKPLPAMPVRVVRVDNRTMRLLVETSMWAPWQKIFDMIGMSVHFTVNEDNIQGTYNVKGGFGIPKDAGNLVIKL